MIFVTVGAQMPFDRLIRAVDVWAGEAGRTDVFAQIGEEGWRPEHIEWTARLTPSAFRERVANARAVIAHAGMGSILTALELGKPIVVMPRRAELRETRNDHQVGTARRLAESGRAIMVADERELRGQLEQIDSLRPAASISATASPELIETLASFIDDHR